MTISIRTFLAQELDSVSHAPLSWSDVATHIRDSYVKNDVDIARRAMHLRRERLYRNEGAAYMHALIDATFSDEGIKDRLKAWTNTSAFDNFLARIVGEHSTVYQEPATRLVGTGTDDPENEKYQQVQLLSNQSVKSAELNAKLTLHRAVLGGFRVRNVGSMKDIRNEPVIDVVTPDRAFLVGHPLDPMHTVAVGVKIKTAYARGSGPSWVVWTEHERFWLNEDSEIVGTPKPHDFGRIPYVFVSLEQGTTSPWPGQAGEDLVSAHMAIWFSNISLMKELKSSTKVPTVSGDTTAAVRGQMADTEGFVELPDGTSVSSLELGMDLNKFVTVDGHISSTAANNHGLSGALLRHQGVQSADARDLMRVPLREIRIKQQIPLREYERAFVAVQAAVIAADMPKLRFDPEGWSIDFADPQTPRSVKERLEEFEHARRLSLDNTVRFVMRQNPDLTPEDARAYIEENVAEEVWRNEAMRPLTDISGSMGARMPDNNSQQSDSSDDGETVSEATA